MFIPEDLYLTNVVLKFSIASTANFSQYNNVTTAIVGWSFLSKYGIWGTYWISTNKKIMQSYQWFSIYWFINSKMPCEFSVNRYLLWTFSGGVGLFPSSSSFDLESFWILNQRPLPMSLINPRSFRSCNSNGIRLISSLWNPPSLKYITMHL